LKTRGVRAIEVGENRGFAAASNIGARETDGDAIFFLNSDTQLDRRCLKALAAALQDHPQYGFFAPKMVSMADRGLLEGAGDLIPKDGRPIKRAAGMSTATPLDPEIISPSGGAALWRRELFKSLNGFDEDFFAYLEDVDLGLRARLMGAAGLYVPGAVVYHLGGGVGRARLEGQTTETPGLKAALDRADVVRLVARNKIWLWAKCFPAAIIIRHALHLALGLIKSAAYHTLLSGQSAAFFKGTIEGLAGLPAMIKKRYIIQSTKIVTDREVEEWIKRASLSLW